MIPDRYWPVESLDERLQGEVGQPQISPDDRAGDDDDDRAGQDLALIRPFDLSQLGGRLGDEAATAPTPATPAGLRLRRLLGGTNRLLPAARALRHTLLLLRGCRVPPPLLAAARC